MLKLNLKNETDLEQEQTDSMEKRLGTEKLRKPFGLCYLCSLL
jgi:hypothetical protein